MEEQMESSGEPRGNQFLRRLQQLEQVLDKLGIHALALNPGPSLVYLTGLFFHLSERPIVVLFVRDQHPMIILPEFEAGKLASSPIEMTQYGYSEDPSSWGAAFRRAFDQLSSEIGVLGYEPRHLRMLEYALILDTAPAWEFADFTEGMAELRMVKDSSERKKIMHAVNIAQASLDAALQEFKTGMTERVFAAELTVQLLQHGSSPDLPFSPIVASGPNSAKPHATPSDRMINPGDLLIIDWGARFDGYISDLTRTFAVGSVDRELESISRLVEEANATARAMVKPGIKASSVDLAARTVIEEAGYGQFFMHRTGHGFGLEAHEPPYIRGDNPQILTPGMTFTIEPGIYLPGKGGVRIEDDVVVTEDGCRSLSDYSRPLQYLG